MGASGAAAGAEQWAGGLNVGLAGQYGQGLASLYTGAGQNLADLSQRQGVGMAGLYADQGRGMSGLAQWFGGNQASTLGGYYGANADLSGQMGNQLNQLDMARAGTLADYLTQRGNVQAGREVAQGNASNNWMNTLLGLGTTGLGVYLSGRQGGGGNGGDGWGSTLGGLFGSGTQPRSPGGIAGLNGNFGYGSQRYLGVY